MANYVLYHTDGCHLCEQAEQVLLSVLDKNSELKLIDILTDEQLIARFQLSIPVFESKAATICIGRLMHKQCMNF